MDTYDEWKTTAPEPEPEPETAYAWLQQIINDGCSRRDLVDFLDTYEKELKDLP